MSLVNIFSNVWFFFMDKKEDQIVYDRVKLVHGISQELCIDNLVKFWVVGDRGEVFVKEIDANLRQDRDNKLILFWESLKKKTLSIVLHGGESIIINSTTKQGHECLIGFYLYMLKKASNIPLEKSVKSLSSKIAGINYKMTEDMKKIIYQVCY